MILRLLLLASVASAFVAAPNQRLSTRTFGITEWRDLGSERLIEHHSGPMVRELPILPRDSHQVLLQGQTTHLQLVEDDEVQLFQRALDKCEGIFGLGLFETCNDEDILLDKMPLLEIQDYKMMGGRFGIFCSVKVVGKATVYGAVQDDDDEGPITVECSECFDQVDGSSLEIANSLASMIENLIYDMSDIEKSCLASNRPSELKRDSPSRASRFLETYEAALDSDRQGYIFKSRSATKNNRSWRELTAISWAAFSTSSCLAKDETFRLNALGLDNVMNRLKLAMYWLSDVRFEIEEAVER